MNKIIYLLVATVIFFSCQNSKKKYYDTGELLSKYHVNNNGEYHGKYILYFKNGNIEEISNYENGILHGEILQYDSIGNLIANGFYKGGKKDGVVKYFHSNGKVNYFINYNNGKRNGEMKIFNEKGIIEYFALSIEDSTVYSKDYLIDSIYRFFKVHPLELYLSSEELANITVEVYGPKEKESKIMYSLYNRNGKEPVRRDTIPLKTDVNTIDVTDLADNNSYYLEVEVFINSKESYFQVVTIKTGNSVLP
jgi:hypothetical protein